MKKISTLICLLIMVCLSGVMAYAQDATPHSEVDTPVVGTHVSGEILSDTTWSLAGSPYIVTGDVTIRHSNPSYGTAIAKLTIDPGVEVRFEPGTGLYVGFSNRQDDYGYYGALSVAGTAEAPVVFTSKASNPSPGDWKGITFRNQTDDSRTSLEYSIVEYGGSTDSKKGNIYCEKADPIIKNSTIRHSSGSGFYLVSSSPTLEDNIISDNFQDGIYSDDKSGAVISGNTINNSAGAAVNIYPQNVENIRSNQGAGNGQNFISIRGGRNYRQQHLGKVKPGIASLRRYGRYNDSPYQCFPWYCRRHIDDQSRRRDPV